MSSRRQHFLLRHLSILVRPGFEPATPRSADQPSPNQANEVAVGSQEPHGVSSCILQAYLCTAFNFAGLGTALQYLCNVHTGSYELVILLPSVLMSNRCYSFSGSRTPVNVVIIRSSSFCTMDVRRFVRNEVSSRP